MEKSRATPRHLLCAPGLLMLIFTETAERGEKERYAAKPRAVSDMATAEFQGEMSSRYV